MNTSVTKVPTLPGTRPSPIGRNSYLVSGTSPLSNPTKLFAAASTLTAAPCTVTQAPSPAPAGRYSNPSPAG